MSVASTTTAQNRTARDYRDAFLELLAGGGDTSASGTPGVRSGFLVVARNTRSLQELQSISQQAEGVPPCLTARYRIRATPAIGTMIAAFAADLRQLLNFNADSHSAGVITGDFQPSWRPLPWDTPWGRLLQPDLSWMQLAATLADPVGALDLNWIGAFFGGLGLSQVPDAQLVLFGEVDEQTGAEAWGDAASSLVRTLPSGIGVVISGAPHDFRLVEVPFSVRYLDLVVPDSQPPTEDVIRYTEAALSGDQPARRDRLNVGRYAAALAKLVLLRDTKPVTIGIHGPWGSGKSSFMELIRQELVKQGAAESDPALGRKLDDVERNIQDKEHELLTAAEDRQRTLNDERAGLEDEREHLLRTVATRAQRRVITVAFNAWRYENATQIWAGLAAAITGGLELSMPVRTRLWARARYAIRHRGGDFWFGFIGPVVLTLIIAAVLIAAGFGIHAKVNGQLPDWLGWITTVLPLTPAFLAIAFIAWRFYLLAQPLGERVAAYVAPINYRDQLGFQNRVLDDLQFARLAASQRFYPGRANAALRLRAPAVVVFIDDLDRCSQDHVMEVLQAINLILGASDYFVFLGIDTEMIYRAIAEHYRLQNDGTDAKTFSESYLRKIVQLSFFLPETTPDTRFDFVRHMFSAGAQSDYFRQFQAGPEVPEDARQSGPMGYDRRLIMPPRIQIPRVVEDTREELQAFADLKVFVQGNPRELKRLVNVHRLTKILLQRSDRPLTVERQRKLVEWLIFCARWPDLVDDAIRSARDDPVGGDAIRRLLDTCDLATDRREIESFWRAMGPEGIIQCANLLEGADLDLAQAAAISQIVRDIAAPPALSLPPVGPLVGQPLVPATAASGAQLEAVAAGGLLLDGWRRG